MSDAPKVKLNSGIEMPRFGLGVWRVPEGETVIESVKYALGVGYRLIDTATIYGNEKGVGEAIRLSGVPREEIFVTTKLWNSDQGYDSAIKALDGSLDNLGLDYIDLYLIHWPNKNTKLIDETWRAFEKLLADKKARAIGVCNFKSAHLEELLRNTNTVPAVNQIELHPYMQQLETREFCKTHDIVVESWSPLMQGGQVLEDEAIKKIAAAHNKTAAQIVLRWHVDNGLIVIPRSKTPSRIKENFQIFDFELSPEELETINGLNRAQRIGPDPDSFG